MYSAFRGTYDKHAHIYSIVKGLRVRDKLSAEKEGLGISQMLGNLGATTAAVTGAKYAPIPISKALLNNSEYFNSKEIGADFYKKVSEGTDESLIASAKKVVRGLKDYPKVSVLEPSKLPKPYSQVFKDMPAAIMTKAMNKAELADHAQAGIRNATIGMPKNFKEAPAILGHELGHILDSQKHGKRVKFGLKASPFALPAAVMGTAFGLTRGPGEERNKILGATSLATLGLTAPNLYTEYKATRIGNKLLRNLYPKAKLGKAMLGTKIGFASYAAGSAALAASPW